MVYGLEGAQDIALAPSLAPKQALSLGGKENEQGNFKDIVMSFLGRVNDLQINADQKMQEAANGTATNLHDVIIAAEQANLAFQFTLQLRNRIIEAYQEVLRMQM
ncbi:MAG: flagellar hook-basal body complex protein FliE [Armatimonadetes bacterium]|nr:flagellar hook-basal body complex protein FliE [Armatimonadota bacterium]